MKANCMARRGLELLGLMMIGEGMIALLHPRRYSLFWKIGPAPLQDFLETLAAHRGITRALCIGEIAVGFWLALREIEE